MEKRQKLVTLLIASVLLGALFTMIQSSNATAHRSTKIRRTILLNFKAEATPAEIQKIFKEVKGNISQLKGVHNLFIGPQINERATFKYGISMDFDDEAALKAYRADQEHKQTHNKYNHLIDQAQITDLKEE